MVHCLINSIKKISKNKKFQCRNFFSLLSPFKKDDKLIKKRCKINYIEVTPKHNTSCNPNFYFEQKIEKGIRCLIFLNLAKFNPFSFENNTHMGKGKKA